ncbi:MAG: GNAT family protein [Nitrolancea sp.]
MLRGERVDLRPIEEGDLAQIEAWEEDPNFKGEYNSFELQTTTYIRNAFAQHGFLSDDHGRLLIVNKADEAVGDVGYRVVKHGGGSANRVYEIGVTIAPEHRRRGFGSEAQDLLTVYLFATYSIARVQATVDVANVAEQRALERAGFMREGTLRQAQFRNGSWHDIVMYSKVRGE